MNGIEQGLAASVAQGPAGQSNMGAMVQQVVQMLMQGISPDGLVQQGVPMEVVRQAVEIVLAQEEQAATTQAAPSTETGLAMTAGRM